MDTGTAAILISAIPFIAVLIYFVGVRKVKGRNLAIVLGTMFLTFFYIITADPSFIKVAFLDKGDYVWPLEIAGLSTFVLLLAVGYYKRGLGGN